MTQWLQYKCNYKRHTTINRDSALRQKLFIMAVVIKIWHKTKYEKGFDVGKNASRKWMWLMKMNNIDKESACYFFIPSLFFLHPMNHSFTPTSSFSVSHRSCSFLFIGTHFSFSLHLRSPLWEKFKQFRVSESSACQTTGVFYWTFCELSRWARMNNTWGDPLTSPSLLKESISIPPYSILQALAPLSAHYNRLWGMRSSVEAEWDYGRELYITFLLVK